MWMTDYIRAIKRQFRDTYHIRATGGTGDDPTFEHVPDGEYPMEIDGKVDRVVVAGGRIRCGNFDPPRTPGGVTDMRIDFDHMFVEIDYTNWRGERSTRLIRPRPDGLYFGSNQWHPEPQWLLHAWDREKGAIRTFAMKDIHSWRPVAVAAEG